MNLHLFKLSCFFLNYFAMSIMYLHFQRVLSYFPLCFIISTMHLHFWGAVMFFSKLFWLCPRCIYIFRGGCHIFHFLLYQLCSFGGHVMFFPNYFGYIHLVSTFSQGVVIFPTFVL